jgi:hypothetical protein
MLSQLPTWCNCIGLNRTKQNVIKSKSLYHRNGGHIRQGGGPPQRGRSRHGRSGGHQRPDEAGSSTPSSTGHPSTSSSSAASSTPPSRGGRAATAGRSRRPRGCRTSRGSSAHPAAATAATSYPRPEDARDRREPAGRSPGNRAGQIGAAVVQQRRATTGGRFNFYGPNYSSRVTREFSNSSSSSHIIQESFNSSSSRPRDRSVTRPCWHSSSSRDSLPWEGTAARSAQEERLAQCRRRRRCTACRACGSSLGMEHISLCVFLHSPSLLNRPRSTARAGRQGIVGRNSLQTGFRASSLSLSQENC